MQVRKQQLELDMEQQTGWSIRVENFVLWLRLKPAMKLTGRAKIRGSPNLEVTCSCSYIAFS